MANRVVLLSGYAGVGKDTVADLLVREKGYVKVSLADPIKRLVMRIFGVDEDTLWGPSEKRSEVVPVTWKHIQILVECIDGYMQDLKDTGIEEVGLRFERLIREPIIIPLAKWLLDRCGGEVTVRYALQWIGTEWGRNEIHDDVWVRYAIEVARLLQYNDCQYSRVLGVGDFGGFHGVPHSGTGYSVVIPDGRFLNEVQAIHNFGGEVIRIIDPEQRPPGEHASEKEMTAIPDSAFDRCILNDKRKGVEELRRILQEADLL